MEELRDTHRLESTSQSHEIERLRQQIAEHESAIGVSQKTVLQTEEEANKNKAEVIRLQAEVERSNGVAREEEEKRVKAISLLKSVRQKLVKAEKEREEAIREANLLKDKEKGERDKDKGEVGRLEGEIAALNTEREKAAAELRAQIDLESAILKGRFQQEIVALQSQHELACITMKVCLQQNAFSAADFSHRRHTPRRSQLRTHKYHRWR
jgi:chromosome segregation ATPase